MKIRFISLSALFCAALLLFTGCGKKDAEELIFAGMRCIFN